MDLFCNLHQYQNKIAVIDDEERSYTYQELDTLAQEFKNKIPRGKKTLILIKCKNNVESLIGYLGGIAGENTVVMVDSTTDKDLIENIIQLYQPEYIWQPRDDTKKSILNYHTYQLVRTDYDPTTTMFPELSLVMLTSGSTGSPKGVRLTRGNLIANAKSIANYLALDDTERPITTLQMNYAYGLSVINSHLYVGATILLTNHSIVKREFWDLFKRHNATSLTGVPYTYEMLRNLRFFDMKLPSLRYMTQAGGKLRAELVAEYAEYSRSKGLRFYVMYGQTEATARISYLPPEFNLKKNKSIGIAIPDGKLFLKDDNGEPIMTPGQEGLLFYEGPNVMLGYAQSRADLAKGDEQSGCLNTHDIAYFDEDGYYYIVGRRSRFIKILGKRVNLDEIENHLNGCGFECASGGYDDLLLVGATNHLHLPKIREICIKKFKIDYENVRIIHLAEIKKNPSGKIKYEETFAEYKNEEQQWTQTAL